MSSKCNSQNQTGQAITDKHDELINELKSYLYDMCKDNLEKGKPRRKTRDTWSRILNDYLNVPYGDPDRTFQQEANKIKMQFDDIAKLFMYNRAQERPCDPSEKWVTWQDIEGKIQRIPGGYPIDERIIAELHDVYREHYKKQRHAFNKLFGNPSTEMKAIFDENSGKMVYDENAVDEQVETIKSADFPRHNNTVHPDTHNWVVCIDETGDFDKNSSSKVCNGNVKNYPRKMVAVLIPADEKLVVNIRSFCSRSGNCSYPISDEKCKFGCLQEWHACDEKYQEVDRVIRLLSSKDKNNEERGCVFIGLETKRDEKLDWAECVEKIIKTSIGILMAVSDGIKVKFCIERWGNYCNGSIDGTELIRRIRKNYEKYVQELSVTFITKEPKNGDDELNPLADAAALAWHRATSSIIDRTNWRKRGVQKNLVINEIRMKMSGTISPEKICIAFEQDAHGIGIDDESQTKPLDPKNKADFPYSYFLESELNYLFRSLRKQGKLNDFKRRIQECITSNERTGSVSTYVLGHVFDWIESLGEQ